MGIDLHCLRLLQYAASKAPFGDVATLGRQNIHVKDSTLQKTLQLPPAKRYGPFCEDLLIEQFGATSVTSFDASDYEHATIVHDMNKPLNHDRQYDTVIDLGTLEHIFDLAVALKNIAMLCKPNGRIIHSLPANNYNGHGFWQFSPELFFSLYATSNGFADTEVYIAELDDEQNWWKAAVPANGVRVEYTSASRSYVLALTRKQAAKTGQTVQQSDYVVNWEQGHVTVPVEPRSMRAIIHSILSNAPLMWRLADVIVPVPNSHSDAGMHRLSASNRHYTKVPVDALLLTSSGPASRHANGNRVSG
jgi:SAM-dependent methyltransferase